MPQKYDKGKAPTRRLADSMKSVMWQKYDKGKGRRASIRAALLELDDGDGKLLNHPATQHLFTVLEDGELPECVATDGDWYAAFATDRRVIIIGVLPAWSNRGDQVGSYAYEDIDYVVEDKGSFGTRIGLVVSGELHRILSANDELIEEMLVVGDETVMAGEEQVEAFAEFVSGKLPKRNWENQEGRIDAQWSASMPWNWDKGTHSGERRILYDILDEDEDIESLIGGTYRAEQDTNRLSKHDGVAAATNKRVVFVDKGVFGNTEVSEMPYGSIEAITYSTGLLMAGVQITGRGMASFRIEDIVEKDSVKPFVDCVRSYLSATAAQATVAPPTQPAAGGDTSDLFVADEIEKLANLLEKGILTQEEFDAKKKQLLGL